jgi:pimeloyl-ACP methyl ester carboxylesterase
MAHACQVTDVLLLPGVVMPASLAFGPLLASLGPEVSAVAKELELYRAGSPPAGYSLDTEVSGIVAAADSQGWGRFHLVGYSGGGAAALAFAAHYPERLLSLGLLEPAWSGNWGWSAAHRAVWREYERLESLAPDEYMTSFMRLGVRPGVTLGPPPWEGEPPAWMALRPAGIKALTASLRTYDLDRDVLARFERPVYCALGGLSNPDDYGEIAERLGRVFPDYTLEVFPERHHFDPPHRIEPDRLAASLRRHWARATAA